MKFFSLLFTLLLTSVAFADERPNIVFVMADDLGLGDVSFHVRNFQKKKPVVETPTLDALAAQGLWFTDGHSATSLCAPTRYAVMSGNNNYRSYQPAGVWSTFGKTAFKKGHATLGTVVRDAGYRTGFVGKWHLGGDFKVPGKNEIFRGKKSGDLRGKVDMTQMVGGGPKYCGFDYDYTSPCGIQGPHYLLYENGKWAPINDDSKIIFMNKDTVKDPAMLDSKGEGMGDSQWDTSQIGKLLSAKAVDFIKTSSAKDEPFFLYYCSPMVHRPHIPPQEFDGKKIAGQTPSKHLDTVLDFDMQMKRIVDALKATGEFENTLFVLTSDNGGLQDGPARKIGYDVGGGFNGSKNSPLEGGHRVPTFAVWPGKIKPGTSDELVVNQDMVSTLAALVGTEIPTGQAQDSNNILPLLTGKGEFKPRSFWVNQAGSQRQVMLRKMPWKLIMKSNPKRTEFEPYALYDLQGDPKEKQNQFGKSANKSVVESMFAEYKELVESGRPTAPSRMEK